MGGRVEVEVEVDVEVQADVAWLKLLHHPPEGRPWLISRHHPPQFFGIRLKLAVWGGVRLNRAPPMHDLAIVVKGGFE